MHPMTHLLQCLDIFFLYPGSCTALANMSTPEASGARGGLTAAISEAQEIEQLKGQFLLLSCMVYMETHMWNWQQRFSFSKGEGKRCWSCSCSVCRDHCNLRTQRWSRVQGFKLIREMRLDDTAEHKQLYCAIMVRGKKQSTIRLWPWFSANCPQQYHQMFHWYVSWLS